MSSPQCLFVRLTQRIFSLPVAARRARGAAGSLRPAIGGLKISWAKPLPYANLWALYRAVEFPARQRWLATGSPTAPWPPGTSAAAWKRRRGCRGGGDGCLRSGRGRAALSPGGERACPDKSPSRCPALWVAPPVHTGDHDDGVPVDAVEDSVGEPVDKRPPGVSMNHGILGRVCNNIIKRGLDGGKKLIAQPGALPLVPEKRFIDIRSSRRTQKDWHHWARLRMRPSTSSQGMPTGPSRSSSSSRRSSSSRCALVSGIASGV